MIKCNRCGNINTAGAVHCQSCGSALSGMDASGNGSNMTSQEQSALPAWLESLRVGERAARPATNSPQFSTADLIEEGSLPSWMHAQRNETQDVTGANLPVSLRSSSLPAPSTDGTPFPATSFAAQSLIDEQSLPSWMQEGAPTSLPPESGISNGNPAWMQAEKASTPLPPEGGISAGNLVDKDSVPDWMKSLQPPQSVVPGQGQPKQAASTERTVKKVEPGLPSSPPASGFSARDLVDQQSLPSWLSQFGNQGPATPSNRDQLGQSSAVNEQPQPIQPGQIGFSARDLVDQQSLPSWMVPQSGQNAAVPTNSERQKQFDQSGAGLPASSLLDMNALPSWFAQNGQAQAVSPGYPQPPASMAPSNQPWSPQQPAVQGSPADFSSVSDSPIAASSVIDMNALPEWLRSSGGQQSALEAPSQLHSTQYAGPPRVENVRVPSRPRSEMSSSETSEMAASVFASMLGVASTAPNFPPAPSGVPYQQQPGQPSQVEQMTLSGVSGIAGMPSQAGMSMAGVGNWGGASMAGMPGGPGAHSMAGMPGGPGAHSMAGMPGGPGAHSMAGMPGGPGAHSMAGMPGGPGAHSMAGMPGGPGAHSMAGMPGGPGAHSMAGIPGGSGIHSMAGMPGGPGAHSMAGIPGGSGIHSMAGMPGGPGAHGMAGIPGGSGIHSMAGNAYGNPTDGLRQNAQGMADEEKNTKKRGLFGALLDWLSR